MAKDFEQVAKAPNEAGSKNPRPARRNGKEKLSGSAQGYMRPGPSYVSRASRTISRPSRSPTWRPLQICNMIKRLELQMP